MMFFRVYQYVVPLLLFPLSYWLWHSRYGGDHRLTLFALALPIVFSYVVPALGTNWLRIPGGASRPVYRISVRVTGPHNVQAYYQSTYVH